jgi:hypothetical protein
MDNAMDPSLWTERACWKQKHGFRIRRPSHRSGGKIPFPCGHTRGFERHLQALFVFTDALVRAVKRRRPLLHTALEVVVRGLQRGLCAFAQLDFLLQRLVQVSKGVSFPNKSMNTPIFERRMCELIGLLR